MDRMGEAWAAGIMAGMVRIIWDSTKGWLCVMVDTIMLRLLRVDIITSKCPHHNNIKIRISSGNKTSREVVVSLVVPPQEAVLSIHLTLLSSNNNRSSNSIRCRKVHWKVSSSKRRMVSKRMMVSNLRSRIPHSRAKSKAFKGRQRQVYHPPEVKPKERRSRLSCLAI